MARKGADTSDSAPRAKRPRTIFVSYSHKDEAWKDRLLPHMKMLVQAGHELDIWHDRRIDAGMTWYPEITQAMENAAVAVCLISSDYLASDFCVKEEVPFLLKRRADDGMLFLPILVRPCQWELFDWLKAIQMLPRDGKCVLVDFKDQEDVVFSEAAGLIHSHVRRRRPALVAPTPRSVAPAPQWPVLRPEFIDLTRLPETGAALFGRQEELRKLDEAWASGQTRIMACVASGGVGKSTLANYWLRERMTPDQFRGARRVFGWTFYSQGTHATATSADFFIHHALKFFGDPNPDAGSPWQKGERLAELAEGALLVLDGMEPLQADFGADRGRVTDPALAGLLRAFTWADSGLCLITTREPLTELMHRETVQALDLDRLSPEAGRAVLRTGGVIGTDEELETLAREFGPHALAITLLASWLHEQPGHRPEAAATLPELSEVADPELRPARRVLAGFEQLLGEGPEIEVLRMLGLFERAAKEEELRALRKGRALPGLTEHVGTRATRKWARALERLRELRLVARQSRHQPDVVDTHPIVREHFGAQVRTQFPAAWKEGHNRLYEHLKQAAPELPDTLEEMMPLFAAVAHGCLAGRHQEACEEIYCRRIQRGSEHYNWKKLGGFGAELAAISGLFKRLWDKPEPSLREGTQGWLLNETGYDLRALGWLAEALQPMRASLDAGLAMEDWAEASRRAGNLSELSLTLGAVGEAKHYALQSVDLADRSGDWAMRMINRAILADALHQASRLEEAEAAFREAEAMQKEWQPQYPLLYSLRGFQYCDLLLTHAGFSVRLIPAKNRVMGDESESAVEICRDVQKRAAQTLGWVEEENWLLDIALDRLSLGRALLLEHVVTPEARSLDAAVEHLDAAVDGLRQASRQDYLPRALLARAASRRLSGDASGAAHDLGDAQELADRSGMKLFQVDGLIEQACQLIADSGSQIADWTSRARECVAQAKALIESTGYHRRDPEIKYLEQLLG